MHTRFLHTLVRIAQVGSFSKVAEEMNATLSTVSMQMKSLEEELGIDLFDRSYRPPMLTPLGRTITTHAVSLLEAEKKLKDACGDSGQLTGTFRVGFVATASVRLLPGFLKKAAMVAPRARFELETALSETLEQKVRNGQLDAAVVTETEYDLSGLTVNLLRNEAMRLAIPAQFAVMPVMTLFESMPFLQFNPGSGIGRLIENAVRQYNPKQGKRVIVLDSVEAIMACVNEGLGFTLLAEPDIRRYAQGQTKVKPLGDNALVRSLSLISGANTLASRDAERIADLFN